MAALRIFARTVISASRELQQTRFTFNYTVLPIVKVLKRDSSFQSSPIYDPETKYTDFEVSNDPNEWSYVEWYLKSKYIPQPKLEDNLPSGYKSPRVAETKKLPYFIRRSKNHMQAVYLQILHRGQRRLTVVKNIDGDIIALDTDLKEYLKNVIGYKVATQISEPGGVIKFRGDFVSRIKEWMDSKGF